MYFAGWNAPPVFLFDTQPDAHSLTHSLGAYSLEEEDKDYC